MSRQLLIFLWGCDYSQIVHAPEDDFTYLCTWADLSGLSELFKKKKGGVGACGVAEREMC